MGVKKNRGDRYKTSYDIFQCQQCGKCCKGFGGTYVTEQNRFDIAEYINFDHKNSTRDYTKNFIDQYCDKSGSRYVLTLGKDGCCIFFDNKKQCTIHPVKPLMCMTWPFIQAVIDHPENWNIMADSCPGMKKNIPYKDLVQIIKIEKKKIKNQTIGSTIRVR